MTCHGHQPLRIALLHHTYDSTDGSGPGRLVAEVAAGLRDAGHLPRVLSSHPGGTRTSMEDGVPVFRSRRPPDGLLDRRGFAGPLTHLPLAVGALLGAHYDVAHAFSAPDALAGLLWRRLTGRPAVFTPTEWLGRERLADRRLRLWSISRAVDGSDAVIAATEESAAALRRWLAVEAGVVESRDGVAHERLYRQLLDRLDQPGAHGPAPGAAASRRSRLRP